MPRACDACSPSAPKMIGCREDNDSQPDSRYPAHLGDHVVPESVRQERSPAGSVVTDLERPTVAVDGGMLTTLRFCWVGTGFAVHRRRAKRSCTFSALYARLI